MLQAHAEAGGCVQYRLSRLVAGPFLRLLAQATVTGAEHVPTSGPAIIASNHLSIIDSIYLPLMLARPVSFAAKSEYFTGTRLRDRLVGAYLRSTNQLSTDRTGGRAADPPRRSSTGKRSGPALRSARRAGRRCSARRRRPARRWRHRRWPRPDTWRSRYVTTRQTGRPAREDEPIGPAVSVGRPTCRPARMIFRAVRP